LAINPGQSNLFRWLSRVAANYESYKFSRLKFDYATEAPSSLGGTLVLAVDYDASDAAPVSKQQAMAFRSSVRSAPWAPCQHSSIAEDLAKAKTNFVRPGPQPPGTDIKTYDIGNLFVISQGVTTAAAVLGELWVEYDVLLMTPVFENGSNQVAVGGSIQGVAGFTPANPFGTSVPVADAQSYGISMNQLSRLSFTFAGYYSVLLDLTGTTITAAALAPGPGIVVAQQLAVPLASGLEGAFMFIVEATNPGYVDITATAATIGGADAYVSVAPLNSLDNV